MGLFHNDVTQHHGYLIPTDEAFVDALTAATDQGLVLWTQRDGHDCSTWHCLWSGCVILFTTGSMVSRALGVIGSDGRELLVPMSMIRGVKLEGVIADSGPRSPETFENQPNLLPPFQSWH